MRKIKTLKDKKRKEKRNRLIISVVLVLVLFFSVFGIIVNSFNNEGNSTDSGIIKYNGIKFTNVNGYWNASVENYGFIFSTNPASFQNITYEGNRTLNNLNNYAGKPLYLYSDDSYLGTLVNQNIGRFAERVQYACYKEEGCPDNAPVKNCDDNFIIIKSENDSKILQDNNCVFIEGTYENLPSLVDKFTLKVLGIE